jgi:hypothetical protein
MCVVPTLAVAGNSDQFGLICHGTVTETAFWKSTSRSFDADFNVDLAKNVFCTDEYCGKFQNPADLKLEYHCNVNQGESCIPLLGLGPLIAAEHFVIDRATGTFHRTLSGTVGDDAPSPYDASYSGNCVISKFTGLWSDGER